MPERKQRFEYIVIVEWPRAGRGWSRHMRVLRAIQRLAPLESSRRSPAPFAANPVGCRLPGVCEEPSLDAVDGG